jgi:glutathione S-transferase
MKLYGRTSSFNLQKVAWLLDELELDYEQIEIGGKFGGLDSDDFLKVNPLQKIPVLIDHEESIWESHTILRYLVASYADSKWYPEDPYQRSLYERWMDWSQVIFQPAFMGFFWGYYRMAESKRNNDAINGNIYSCIYSCINCLKILDKQLEKTEYLAGDDISLADIPSGAILYRLTEQGVEVPLPANVSRWYELLKKRDPYKRWVMSDFSELKNRENF